MPQSRSATRRDDSEINYSFWLKCLAVGVAVTVVACAFVYTAPILALFVTIFTLALLSAALFPPVFIDRPYAPATYVASRPVSVPGPSYYPFWGMSHPLLGSRHTHTHSHSDSSRFVQPGRSSFGHHHGHFAPESAHRHAGGVDVSSSRGHVATSHRHGH